MNSQVISLGTPTIGAADHVIAACDVLRTSGALDWRVRPLREDDVDYPIVFVAADSAEGTDSLRIIMEAAGYFTTLGPSGRTFTADLPGAILDYAKATGQHLLGTSALSRA